MKRTHPGLPDNNSLNSPEGANNSPENTPPEVEGADNNRLTSPDTEDEGISDISTHETIINPSRNNERFPSYPLTKFIQK